MNEFTTYGYFSELPIFKDDPIFALICVYRKSSKKYYSIKNNLYLTPVYFPIFGLYDGFGGIKDIEYDYNSDYLREKLNMPLDKVIEIINDYTYKYNIRKEEVNEITKNLFSEYYYLQYRDYDICVTIDHKHVYKYVCARNWLKAQESFEISEQNEELSNSNLSDYLQKFSEQNETYNMNPYILSGYWNHYYDSFYPHMLLSAIKNTEGLYDFWKAPNFKYSYIEFMAFWSMSIKLYKPVSLSRRRTKTYGAADWKTHWLLLEDFRTVLYDNNYYHDEDEDEE